MLQITLDRVFIRKLGSGGGGGNIFFGKTSPAGDQGGFKSR